MFLHTGNLRTKLIVGRGFPFLPFVQAGDLPPPLFPNLPMHNYLSLQPPNFHLWFPSCASHAAMNEDISRWAYLSLWCRYRDQTDPAIYVFEYAHEPKSCDIWGIRRSERRRGVAKAVCGWLGNVFRVDTRYVVFSSTQRINTLVLIAFKPGASCTPSKAVLQGHREPPFNRPVCDQPAES